jgi:hypothetical protein
MEIGYELPALVTEPAKDNVKQARTRSVRRLPADLELGCWIKCRGFSVRTDKRDLG